MPEFNQVVLIGNLVRDSELRFTGGGKPVANNRLAINHTWKDDSGEKKQSTCYVDITLWGKSAETFHKHTGKGSCVLVNGRLTYEETEKDGTTYRNLFVTVDTFQFLDRKPETENPPQIIPGGKAGRR